MVHEGHCIHTHVLVPDDSAKSCHCVVSGMIELVHFLLFLKGICRGLDFDGCFEGSQAVVGYRCEGRSTMLGSLADAVDGCLSDWRGLGGGEAAQLLAEASEDILG